MHFATPFGNYLWQGDKEQSKNWQIYHREKETNYRPREQNDWWCEDFFSICDRILKYNEQVVILGALKRILKDFHTDHLGMARIKALMRSYVFWLNMDKELVENVESCRSCVIAGKAPPVKFTPWPKTDKP